MQKAALIALAVALCAVAVVAQHPRHCNSPYELEAHAFQVDPKLGFFRRGRVFYDAWNERTALIEEIDNSTTRDFFHTIHVFRERRAYYINLKTKNCEERHEDVHFRPWHIPHEAHFRGDAIVGTNAFPESGVLTTHWEHHNDTDHSHWFGVFTDGAVGCVPVSDHFYDPNVGPIETQFFDVVLGIGDPNVFVPPNGCKHAAKAKPARTPLMARPKF